MKENLELIEKLVKQQGIDIEDMNENQIKELEGKLQQIVVDKTE